MSYALDYPLPAAQAPADARAAFIRRTYAHLAGSVVIFAALETLLLSLPGIGDVVRGMASSGGLWLALMVGFIAVSWVANSWAQSSTSPATQYAGLLLYVTLEAVIFLPILYIAENFYPGVIQSAAAMTLTVFLGLTAAVFVTKRDFSYLGSYLAVGSILALGFIVASIVLGFNIGLVFCFAMVALACGYIIYDTSNIMHRYRTDQHVAAALALFASVALLFWYILRIAMASRD